jgi:hypothetical protein
MELIDRIIVVAFLVCTGGTAAGRALSAIVEFRIQRRVARLLERNAELLEREGLPTPTHLR